MASTINFGLLKSVQNINIQYSVLPLLRNPITNTDFKNAMTNEKLIVLDRKSVV